jgi:thermitase
MDDRPFPPFAIRRLKSALTAQLLQPHPSRRQAEIGLRGSSRGTSVKRHIVIKLVAEHPDDDEIPHWVLFADDKSKTFDRVQPVLDRLLRAYGLKVWLTSEYDTAAEDWDEHEIRAGLNRTYRLILQDDTDLPPALIDQIRLLPAVEDAHPIEVVEAPIPAAPSLSLSSISGGQAPEMIGLPYAKALTKGDPRITVAILDTGVDLGHRELQGKIDKRFDFVDLQGIDTRDFVGRTRGLDANVTDDVGHGTHVSGIIAATGINMNEGVCPDCRLMAVRVLATMKSGDRLVGAGIVDNINNGIKWAVDNGADVINMSLGIRNAGGGLPHEDVIRYAISKGVTVVAASGNDGTADRYYPGALPGVIAVGAVDNGGAVTNFTSYGANITVVAPGVNIYSSFAHDTYALASGTSQASPFVAGTVALLKSFGRAQGRNLTTSQIVGIFRRTSDRPDRRLRSERAGYGLINVADAFRLMNAAFD